MVLLTSSAGGSESIVWASVRFWILLAGGFARVRTPAMSRDLE